MAKISRRQIVGGALTGGIPFGIGGVARGASDGQVTADVCVVGAGFAGLAAAYRLKQAGADVVVLEARDRVGGRSLTVKTGDGAWVDFGAQWVGPTQDRFLALIKEVGCETYPTPYRGAALQLGLFDQNKYHRIGREDPSYPGDHLVNAGWDRLDRLAERLDPETPWTYPNAEQLDAMTFAEWLRQSMHNRNAQRFVGDAVSAVAWASPEEISLLHVLFLIKSCGGLDMLLDDPDKGSAQQNCVLGGTQIVAQRLADKLGGTIRHGQPVRRLEWNEKGGVVHADGISVAARHVIFAVPPQCAGAIEYNPSLPVSRVQVTQRWPQGARDQVAHGLRRTVLAQGRPQRAVI